MATKSFLENVVLKDEKTISKYFEIANSESPVKHIQPVSEEKRKKGKEYAKKWLSSH